VMGRRVAGLEVVEAIDRENGVASLPIEGCGFKAGTAKANVRNEVVRIMKLCEDREWRANYTLTESKMRMKVTSIIKLPNPTTC
jgi:hypothetical protein